ncbi:MAG: Ubiquinone/menaquinone biosynthesis C-methyltransferase UbiE [Planctomycetota bacterium]
MNHHDMSHHDTNRHDMSHHDTNHHDMSHHDDMQAKSESEAATPAPSANACCGGAGCCDGTDERPVAFDLLGAGARAVGRASPAAPIASAPASEAIAHDALREQVRSGYASIAATGSWSARASTDQAAATESVACCAGGGCCGPSTFTPEELARAIGYSSDELAAVPDGSNMGLSCGNPTAIASLRAGETVLDLGSGGGFDCFIAGAKVGATGRVIGVDMTPAMLSKARANAADYARQTGLSNVEFRLGEIEHLPVADGAADVVISNCVLNLSPDKAQVWREIARVLKRGGRVAVSDLALLRPLPDAVRADLEALVGCIAGAMLVDEMRELARAAGFTEIRLEAKSGYVDAMTDWQDPLYRRIVEALPAGSRVGDFVTSLDVTAVKP